ncbi:hypothetical protein L2E82_30495 [Cichorium intybus]|uniref:Uncharacterized protein n=1 Tax=Cichorium intybus TaxID=13427 RepID=A0ACB9D0F4_CICIN|nr:hypothetical protein L2E82_30495 [Cichorium intybus]
MREGVNGSISEGNLHSSDVGYLIKSGIDNPIAVIAKPVIDFSKPFGVKSQIENCSSMDVVSRLNSDVDSNKMMGNNESITIADLKNSYLLEISSSKFSNNLIDNYSSMETDSMDIIDVDDSESN